jgi:hypothetical protein
MMKMNGNISISLCCWHLLYDLPPCDNRLKELARRKTLAQQRAAKAESKTEAKSKDTKKSPSKGKRKKGNQGDDEAKTVDEKSDGENDGEEGETKVVTTKAKGTVAINPYHTDDEEPIYIRESVAQKLKPHQIEGNLLTTNSHVMFYFIVDQLPYNRCSIHVG